MLSHIEEGGLYSVYIRLTLYIQSYSETVMETYQSVSPFTI